MCFRWRCTQALGLTVFAIDHQSKWQCRFSRPFLFPFLLQALGGSSGRPGTAQTEHTQQSVSTVAELFSRLDATRSASKAGSIATHSVASRRPGPGGGGGNVSVRAQGSVAGFGPQSPGSPARSAVWRPSGNA